MNGTNNTAAEGGGEQVPAGVRLSDIERVSPHSLRPHPLNERMFTAEPEGLSELRTDIAARGILVALIARPDGTLLAGHNRLRIALELGLSEVPVQRVPSDITPQQEREFLIKDNVLRRQLSAEDKVRLIRELYPDEIMSMRHGGDRRSEIKVQMNLDLPLHKRIERETGIASGTAKRLVAGIRRELGLVPARGSSVLRSSLSSETQNDSALPARAARKSASRARKKVDPVQQVVRYLNSVRRTAADARTARAALEHLDEVRRELRKLARE